MTITRRSLIRTVALGATGLSARAVVAQGKRQPSLSNPTPDDAREFAATAVKLARDIEGKTLDYSPDSLRHIDSTVLSFKQSGKSTRDVAGTLVIFGCYVGEVLVRGLGAAWEMPNEEEQKLGFRTVGVRTKSGAFWDPITKVFKLLVNGKEDSVEYLYSVAKSREP